MNATDETGIYMWTLPPTVDRQQWIQEHSIRGFKKGEFEHLLDVRAVLVGIIGGVQGSRYPVIDVDMVYDYPHQLFFHVTLPQSDYLYLRRAGEIVLDEETGRPTYIGKLALRGQGSNRAFPRRYWAARLRIVS